MRNWRALFSFGAIFLMACGTHGDEIVVIANVSVIDVGSGEKHSGQTVVIRGSQIERIAATQGFTEPRGASIIDGTGRYLIPGLWDMHVHVAGNDRALQVMLGVGITGVRDMGGDFAQLAEARRRIEQGRFSGPRLILGGPALRGPKSPSDASDADSWVLRTPADARKAVDSLSVLGVDFVKVHEDLARETFYAVAEAARAKRMPVVGHVPAGLSPSEASDAGERSIEHLEWVADECLVLFNGGARSASAAVLRACGPDTLALVLRRLAANGTWLDPTIGSFRYWAPAQWPMIKDAFRDAAREIRRSGIPVLAGTDWSTSLEARGAPPGGSLHDELALLVEAGFSPLEALQSATSNAARFLGLEKTLGTVQVGKTADLVLLDGDPLQDIHNTARVAVVIREGRVLSSGRESLAPPR